MSDTSSPEEVDAPETPDVAGEASTEDVAEVTADDATDYGSSF